MLKSVNTVDYVLKFVVVFGVYFFITVDIVFGIDELTDTNYKLNSTHKFEMAAKTKFQPQALPMASSITQQPTSDYLKQFYKYSMENPRQAAVGSSLFEFRNTTTGASRKSIKEMLMENFKATVEMLFALIMAAISLLTSYVLYRIRNILAPKIRQMRGMFHRKVASADAVNNELHCLKPSEQNVQANTDCQQRKLSIK